MQFVQKGCGGSLFIDVVDAPPHLPAADPAPVVTLLHPDGANALVAEQAATAGPATALAAAAAAGASAITVADATGIDPGDQLLLGPSAAEEQHEWATVKGVGSDKVLELLDELRFSYATSDAVASPRLSVSVSSSEADAIRRNCVAKWGYTLNGEERETHTLFSITQWSPVCPLTEQHILRRDPRARTRAGGRNDLSMLIHDLWGELLEEMGERLDPGALVSGTSLATALRYRVLAELETTSHTVELRDHLMAQFKARWDGVLHSTPIDVDASGVITEDDIVRPAWSGRVRRS